jgi:hypothetical protein
MTSALVRSGYVAAKSAAIGPPSEMPRSAARSQETASSTARTSSMRVSRSGSPPGRSDSPVPRLSNRISRANDERRSLKWAERGSSQSSSTCETNPMTMTRSSGPSPVTW